MTDQPRRRRMSRHATLVLLTSLPGLAGCGGCGGRPAAPVAAPAAPEPTEEVEEEQVEPPPTGPEHLVGAPFVGWWHVAHPPVIVRRVIPRSAVASGGYVRSGTGVYRRTYYGGRSVFLGGSHPSGPGPAHASPISRGGFGSTGHGAVGG